MEAPTGASDQPRAPNHELEAPPLLRPVQAAPPPVQAAPPPVQAAPPRPCHIVFEGLVASEPPRTEIRAWLERLGALTAPMTGGEVAISAVDQGRKERQYRVRLKLAMPAGAVIVGPDHPGNAAHEDIYVAIRNAFRAARRQLELQPQPQPQPQPDLPGAPR